MRKVFLTSLLAFLSAPAVVFGDEIVMFPIPAQSEAIMSGIIKSKPSDSPSIKLFYETNENTTYVCINAVLPNSGKCGNTTVKECYASSGNPTIQVIGSKNYDRLNGSAMLTDDFFFSLAIKDETNNKRCQVSVTGSRAKGEIYLCDYITLKCF